MRETATGTDGVLLGATPLFAQAATAQLSSRPGPSSTPSAVPEIEGGAADFRAYEGGGEQRSGELLLIEAYAAIWLVAFVLVLLSIRRQKQLEQRLDRLQDDLKRAAEQQEQR